MKRARPLFLLLFPGALIFWLSATAFVQAQDIPAPIPGEALYIPFPVSISVDGNLDDWAGIPTETVVSGPTMSDDPAENGSFTFAAAADSTYFYIYMTMPDKTIVTGQHGTNFWNEDSLEFYVNFTDDIFREDYTANVFQANINPGDIDNTDPTALTITGTNSASVEVTGIVFATDDGWGFEAAVPLPEGFVPEHGREIGLQAHANGSSGADRDVKLIWSNADTGDTSWQNPAVFGKGIFYELGSATVPEPSSRLTATEEEIVMSEISINQVGYFPDAPKFGMLANAGSESLYWGLLDAETSAIRLTASTQVISDDAASGDTLQVADFSEFNTVGRYRLLIGNTTSAPFTIGTDIYQQLRIDALRYFYLNRSGIELEADYAGEDHARAPSHVSDDNVTCYRGTDAEGQTWEGCSYSLNARGGWYDAGDYGKYVVNGGISLWTLLNLYERLPDALPDGALNIPESGNGLSDLLDEGRWEMEFLLSMQVPAGEPQAGMVHHKLHDLAWEAIPALPVTEFDNNNDFRPGNGRYVYPPSTAATYNLAATAAQCARIWRGIDTVFAERCLLAAQTAFQAAQDNPVAIAGNTPGSGGGNYDDRAVADELFWAAAELYITTDEAAYLDAMKSTPYLSRFGGTGKSSAMYWGDTAALGALSLVLHAVDLPEVEQLQRQIVLTANSYSGRIAMEGYRVPIAAYPWGSNSAVLNNAIILAYAYDISGDTRYLGGMTESMDYILGRNALAFSFVSGYGERAMTNPHHRFWGNEPANGYPAPPPGVVAGGPNGEPSDPTALAAAQLDAGPARRCVDLRGSWSTNEVTINWNAPLAWVATYLDSTFNLASQ